MSDPALERIRVLFHQLDHLPPRSPAYAQLVTEIRAAVDARALIVGDEMEIVAAPSNELCSDRPNATRRIHRTRRPTTPFDPPSYAGRLRMAKANLPW